MKTTALIAAALIAGGTAAYANDKTVSSASDDTRVEKQEHSTGLRQKLRRGMHKLGEKTHHALHRDRSDTRAMGAGRASDDTAGSRQKRMDDAYANWQSKQDKQEKSH